MSVEGGVRNNRTFGRKIKDVIDDTETLYGLVNSIDQQSGTPKGADIGTGSTTVSKQEGMPLTGGTFEGPPGAVAEAIIIIGGNLKLNENSAGDPLVVRKIIFVAVESGTTDDLDTIEGRLREGQEHTLVGVVGNTLTIKHNNTGAESNDERAILCPGDTDFTLTGDDGGVAVVCAVVWYANPRCLTQVFAGYVSPATKIGNRLKASISPLNFANSGGRDPESFAPFTATIVPVSESNCSRIDEIGVDMVFCSTNGETGLEPDENDSYSMTVSSPVLSLK